MLRKTLNNKKKSKKQIALVIILIIVALGLALLVSEKTRLTNLIGIDGLLINTEKEKLAEGVNYGPSTEQEQQETEEHKEKLADEPSQPTTDIEGFKVVTPVISYVDTESINAYIPTIFEENGTCTATLRNGATSFSRQSKGFGNASYTQCEPIDITGTGASKGWDVTVEYKSPKSRGSSEVITIP